MTFRVGGCRAWGVRGFLWSWGLELRDLEFRC